MSRQGKPYRTAFTNVRASRPARSPPGARCRVQLNDALVSRGRASGFQVVVRLRLGGTAAPAASCSAQVRARSSASSRVCATRMTEPTGFSSSPSTSHAIQCGPLARLRIWKAAAGVDGLDVTGGLLHTENAGPAGSHKCRGGRASGPQARFPAGEYTSTGTSVRILS